MAKVCLGMVYTHSFRSQDDKKRKQITESRLLRPARFPAIRIGEQESGMTHLIERWMMKV